ncbi:MAG TPA: TonB-dependent receptor [Bryobacteraceae bacterium]|nr:TonB-dependent receptor [Bryobacteraceae bacterium]
MNHQARNLGARQVRSNSVPGLLVLLLAILLPHAVQAQRQAAELRLHVQDPAGLPIAAAAQLESAVTETRLAVTLYQDGSYTFKDLPFGSYRLTISQSGFQTFSDTVELHSQLPVSRTVTLALNPVGTVVEVRAEQMLVDAGQVASAQHLGAETIRDRDTTGPGRGLVDLVAAQPGWLLEANGVLHPRGFEYATQYIVNGFPVQDNRSPAFAPNFEADDIQSVRILTAGYPAEYGKKLGGVIEVTTERNQDSGFHGSAVIEGGSFASLSGDLSAEYVTPKMAASVNGEGFLTDRYLDPPVTQNYTNHASNSSFGASLDRDLSANTSLWLSVNHRETRFLVPDEQLQADAGQRQDRNSVETSGQISLQHTFSPALVMSVRGSFRDVAAQLWSNPLSTPIAAAQNRGFREAYINSDLAGHHGHHDWKVGAEASLASIREAFSYSITAYAIGGVSVFDPDTPAQLAISGHRQDREESAYAQDTIRLGNATISAGLRYDHYRLLVADQAWSPRLAASWYFKPAGLLFRAAYDRIFSTPAIENILVSGSPLAATLADSGLYLPLQPSRGNFYQAGFSRAFFNRLRFDADWYLRDIRNFGDDDLLLNTGVSFPIAFDKATIHGAEAKIEIPRWGRVSGFVSYSWMQGIGSLPIAGGLFLDAGSASLLQSHDTFAISQDQRNTASARFNVELSKRVWAAASASYGSGLPVELPDGQDLPFLIGQYGAAVVSRVNFDRGRLKPSAALNFSTGALLWRHEKRSLRAQMEVLNVNNRLNLINFAGLLSGTAIAAPRSLGIRLRAEW